MQHQPADLFRHAVALHQAGDLLQAEPLYRQFLTAVPNHPDGLHLLGLLLHQVGQSVAGLTLIERAIQMQPGASGYHDTRGKALKALGRLSEAIEAYRLAVRLAPRDFGPHYNLGNALYVEGRFEEAAESYRQAIRREAGIALAHNNLGNAYRALGRMEDAEAAFRTAVRLQPDAPDLLFNLGAALAGSGALPEACAALGDAVRLRPGHEATQELLGTVWSRRGDWATAAVCYEQALQVLPDSLTLCTKLSEALAELNRFDAAADVLRTALRRMPGVASLWSDLSNVLCQAGRLEEAAAACVEALRLDPDLAAARYNLSIVDLTAGRFADGWEGYESRWPALKVPTPFDGPAWDGTPAPGQVLTVYEEQGAGDYIQFCRLVPLLAERMAVTLRVPHALRRLVSTLAGPQDLVVVSEPAAPPVAAKASSGQRCSMLSLPHAMQLTMETLPTAPYLHADPAAVAAWRTRLSVLPGLRVGLAWAGFSGYPKDRNRSIPAEALSALAGTPGISFISLQKGGASWTVPSPEQRAALGLADWTAELGDFADTAALIAALDLVISVDTAVAHLAGAIGQRIWLLNRFDTDWRWMRDREDSPWYPSMRIFRQAVPGDWTGALTRVQDALKRAHDGILIAKTLE